MSTLKTGKVKTTTIADELDTESTAVTNVINGSAKAWVNFNGRGTVAIRRGFNVSSITDNSTGNFTVNFTTAMTDVNYAVFISVDRGSSGDIRTDALGAVSTTSVQMTTRYAATLEDMDFCRVAVFS